MAALEVATTLLFAGILSTKNGMSLMILSLNKYHQIVLCQMTAMFYFIVEEIEIIPIH